MWWAQDMAAFLSCLGDSEDAKEGDSAASNQHDRKLNPCPSWSNNKSYVQGTICIYLHYRYRIVWYRLQVDNACLYHIPFRIFPWTDQILSFACQEVKQEDMDVSSEGKDARWGCYYSMMLWRLWIVIGCWFHWCAVLICLLKVWWCSKT